jgi:integrase
LKQLFKWHRGQTGTFVSPLVSDDFRAPERASAGRTLADTELVKVWVAAEQSGLYGALVRFMLLTGCRLGEALAMRRSQVVSTVWTLPGDQTKNRRALVLPLPAEALRILDDVPQIDGGDLVFTFDGKHPFGNDAKAKKKLDAASGVTGWRQHDLRHTAKTLMQRAGVTGDVCEAVLNHKAPGIEGRYGQYDFLDEKRAALRRLSLLVGGIVGLSPQVSQ